MFRADMVVDPKNAPFQQAPKVVDVLGMNIAPYILISRMPDVFMRIVNSEELVGGQFVGIYLGAGGDLIADNGVGSAGLSVFYRNRVNLAAPFYYPQDRDFVVNPLYSLFTLGLVFVDLLASDIGLVYFNLAG